MTVKESRTTSLLETNVKTSVDEFLWRNTKRKPETSLKQVMERNYLNEKMSAQNIVGETVEDL